MIKQSYGSLPWVMYWNVRILTKTYVYIYVLLLQVIKCKVTNFYKNLPNMQFSVERFWIQAMNQIGIPNLWHPIDLFITRQRQSSSMAFPSATSRTFIMERHASILDKRISQHQCDARPRSLCTPLSEHCFHNGRQQLGKDRNHRIGKWLVEAENLWGWLDYQIFAYFLLIVSMFPPYSIYIF